MNSELNPFEPPKAVLDDVVAAPEAVPALWNPDAAGAWSLLLSPIFGSVLVRKNWQAIGDAAKTRAGTIWLAVSILVLAWYFAWQRPQTRYIRERWGKDYPRKGWLAPLVVAVVIYLGAVFAMTMILMAVSTLYR